MVISTNNIGDYFVYALGSDIQNHYVYLNTFLIECFSHCCVIESFIDFDALASVLRENALQDPITRLGSLHCHIILPSLMSCRK